MRYCERDDCWNKYKAKGLCQFHYQRRRMGFPLDIPPLRVHGRVGCEAAGCDRPHHANGFCKAHVQRWRKGKPIDTPIRSRSPDGATRMDSAGYILQRVSNHHTGRSWIYQHRLVIEEQHLKRPLEPDEQVHHKNGIRHDNRLENLEVWVGSHAKGVREPDLQAWCIEYLTERGFKIDR